MDLLLPWPVRSLGLVAASKEEEEEEAKEEREEKDEEEEREEKEAMEEASLVLSVLEVRKAVLEADRTLLLLVPLVASEQ